MSMTVPEARNIALYGDHATVTYDLAGEICRAADLTAHAELCAHKAAIQRAAHWLDSMVPSHGDIVMARSALTNARNGGTATPAPALPMPEVAETFPKPELPEEWDAVATEWEMACPGCASGEYLDITAKVDVRLKSNGTDADESQDGNHEWDEYSPCSCGSCDWRGTVAEAEKFFCDNTDA